MRLSKFIIKLIWFIGLSTLVVIAFYLELRDGNRYTWIRPEIGALRIFSVIFLFFWTVGLADTLRDMVVFKYKIIDDTWRIDVKYLTLWWLFIPYWKAINTEWNTYETQNVFGAKYTSGYSTDVSYKNKDKALKAIEKHKKVTSEAIKDWFKTPDPKSKNVTYL